MRPPALRPLVLGLAVAAIGSFALLLAVHLLDGRARLLAQAQADAVRRAHALSAHTEDSLSGIDKLLSGLGEVLRVSPDGMRPHSPETLALLRRRLIHLPEARSLLVLDEQGRLINDTDGPPPTPIDLSDRPYFLVHARNTAAGLYVGEPIQGRRSGNWILAMSRRLTRADGSFAGVAVAVLDPARLSEIYRTASGADRTVVSLFRSDGAILVREPGREDYLGERIALEVPKAEGRIVAQAESDSYPVAVRVEVDRDAVLAEWQSQLAPTLGFGFAVSAIFLSLAWLSLRLFEKRARAMADMRAAIRESELANRAKTQFLANMSHELRTPLNAIIGFSELLTSRAFGELNAKQDEYARDITLAGRQLLELINTLLDVSKLESDVYALREETVELDEVARLCLRQVAVKAGTKGLELALEMPRRLELRADPRALRQMLWNLLGNAVKFTPEGGRITVSARRAPDGWVELAVADTGIGIPPEEQAEVFAPFRQVDNFETRRHDGAGLGLYLVRSLVELHGGTVSLASTLGQGTTFTIRLPPHRLIAEGAAPEAQPLAAG